MGKKLIITVLITFLVLLAIVVSLSSPGEIWREMTVFPGNLLVAAFLTVIVAWFFDAIRLSALSRAIGHRPPFLVLVVTLIGSNFLTLITPFAAGGAPLVVYILRRYGLSIGEGTAVVVGGGIAAQFALFTLVNMAVVSARHFFGNQFEFIDYFQGAALVYGLLLLGLFIAGMNSEFLRRKLSKLSVKFTQGWPAKVLHFVDDLLQDFEQTFRLLFSVRNLSWFGLAYLGGFFYYFFLYTSLFFLMSGFAGVPQMVLARQSLAIIMGAAPLLSPLPGGTGAAEYLGYVFFHETLPPEELATFIVLWRLVLLYFPVIAGGLSFFALTVNTVRKK